MTLPLPSQASVAVGQRLTSALWNDDVRDAVTFLANPPIFKGYASATQSIPNNAITSVTLDIEDVDTYSGHSTSVNNSRYTIQLAGYYMIMVNVSWPGASTGARIIGYRITGSGAFSKRVEVNATAGSTTRLQLCCIGVEQLSVSDYVEAAVYQNSGAAVNITAGFARTSLSVVWLHA